MKSVVKVNRSALVDEPGPSSLIRRHAIATPELWAGMTTVDGGVTSGWHHHGSYTTVFYVLSGRFAVEYIEDEVHTVEAGPGDFVVVPDGVLHNEIFEPDVPVEAVVIRYGPGEGPTTIEVTDPPSG